MWTVRFFSPTICIFLQDIYTYNWKKNFSWPHSYKISFYYDNLIFLMIFFKISTNFWRVPHFLFTIILVISGEDGDNNTP